MNPGALADTYLALGAMLTKIGRFDEGLAYLERVVAIRKSMLDANPTDRGNRGSWIDAQLVMARGWLAAGKAPQALQCADTRLEAAGAMVAGDPSNSVYRRDQWVARMVRANALGVAGNHAGAAAEYRQVLDLIAALADADPGDRGHRRGVAVNWLGLADSLVALKQPLEAERAYSRAVAESEALWRQDPKKIETTIDLGRMYTHLGRLYGTIGNLSQAQTFLEKGRRLIDEASAKDPQDAALQKSKAEAGPDLLSVNKNN